MAYVEQLTDEEEKKRQAQLQAGGAVAPGAGTVAPNAPRPGQFASFIDFVKANQPQTAQLAQTLAGRAEQGIQSGSQSVAQVGQTYADLVKSGAAPETATETVNKALKNPTGYVQSPADVAAFRAIAEGRYTGPYSLEGESELYVPAKEKLDKSLTTAELLTDPNNYNQALREIVKNPTPGKVGLDEALLRVNPEAGKILSTLTPKIEQTRQTWNDLLEQSKALSAEAAQRTTGAAELAKSGVSNLKAGTEQTITARAQQAEAQRQKVNGLINRLKSVVEEGSPTSILSDEDMRDLGLFQGGQRRDIALLQFQTYHPVGWLEKYFPGTVEQANAYNASNVASQSEYAYLRALDQLAGGNGRIFGLSVQDQSKVGPVDPSKIGPVDQSVVGSYAGNKPVDVSNTFIKPEQKGDRLTYYDTLPNGTHRFIDQNGELRYADGSYWNSTKQPGESFIWTPGFV